MIIGAGGQKPPLPYGEHRANIEAYDPPSIPHRLTEKYCTLLSLEGIDVLKELTSRTYYKHRTSPNYAREQIVAYCNLLIHIILKKSLRHSIDIGPAYISIHSELLESIHRNYRDIVDFLVEANIIERHNYRTNAFSFKHRISYKYFRKQIICIRCHDKKVIKFLQDETKDAPAIFKFYNENLSVDISENELTCIIEKAASEHQTDICRKYTVKKGSKRFDTLLGNYKKSVYAHLQNSIKSFNLNCHDYIIKEDSRHFNSFTACISDLRKHIRYKDEPLIEIDISNAVAYLSLAIFNYNKDVFDSISKSDPKLDITRLKDLIKKVPEQELVRYQKQILKGTIYEFINSKLDKCLDRDKIKDQFSIFMFDKNTFESPVKSVFETHFPSISNVFSYIKSNFKKRNSEGRTQDDTGNALANCIYSIESKLVIEKVAMGFHKKHPFKPIYTVHDALLTTKQGLLPVEDLLRLESKKYIGFVAPYKTSMTDYLEAQNKIEQNEGVAIPLPNDNRPNPNPIF